MPAFARSTRPFVIMCTSFQFFSLPLLSLSTYVHYSSEYQEAAKPYLEVSQHDSLHSCERRCSDFPLCLYGSFFPQLNGTCKISATKRVNRKRCGQMWWEGCNSFVRIRSRTTPAAKTNTFNTYDPFAAPHPKRQAVRTLVDAAKVKVNEVLHCSWVLTENDAFCSGDWGVERERLGSTTTGKANQIATETSMSWAECAIRVVADSRCGDIAYSNAKVRQLT